MRATQAVRTTVGRSIEAVFPAREAGLLMGLALGDDSHLDPGVERDFKATGLTHLLVVSGGNVAMVLGPVLALVTMLGVPRSVQVAIGLATVAFIVVLTGAEPSVMRAGTMSALTLVGLLLGRARSTAVVLSGAVLVLLIVQPVLVRSIGFQLSVTATAGMVAMAAPLGERFARVMPAPVAAAAGTTLAAQLGVTPILLFHFHDVPGVTLLANVVAAPTVAPSLLLGLVAAACGIVAEPLGHLVGLAAQVPMRALQLIANVAGRAPSPTSPRAAARSCSSWAPRSWSAAHRGAAHRLASAAPGRDRRRARAAPARVELGRLGRTALVAHRAVPRRGPGRRGPRDHPGRRRRCSSTADPTRSWSPPSSRRSA